MIRSFIKYTPAEFDVRLVGTGVGDSKMPAGQWHHTEYAGRELQFFPLFELPDDNVRHLIPTSVRYTLALLRRDLSSDFMLFYRLEPSFASMRWPGQKVLYVANDIYKKLKDSSEHQSVLWQRFPWLYFAVENALLQQFNQVLYCTSESLQFYKEQYPSVADRISYVRNTVDGEVFYPLSDAERESCRKSLTHELSLPEDTQFLLFAGRLHPQKDPLMLVQSMTALQDPSAHLLIAGDGELMPAVREEVQRLNLSKRITLLGSVDQARLSKLYHASRAFVLSSVYEGLPIVALEALACGIPIVTTIAGDTAKLLTPESGVVCEERNATLIAQAMARILEHPELYPQEACTKAAEPYIGKQVVKEICEDMLQNWESREFAINY